MLVIDKMKRVLTDWRRLRQENEESIGQCKKLSKHVDQVKRECDILEHIEFC